MSLEQHVPSRELCEEWKRRGGRQDTLMCWHKYSNNLEWQVVNVPVRFRANGDIAAPLVSEMMEWLKAVIDVSSTIEEYEVVLFASAIVKRDKSLPNALMQMCISRKEEEDGMETK